MFSNDNIINNSFEGVKFTSDTKYYMYLVYDKDGIYIGFIIAETYFKFFINTGQKDNDGNTIGSTIHKEKENIEWTMKNYKNEN